MWTCNKSTLIEGFRQKFIGSGLTRSHQSKRFTNSTKSLHLCKIMRRPFSAKPVEELQGLVFCRR